MAENYYYSSLSGQEIEDTLLGAVRFNTDQQLTTSEKAAARANIGAGESNSTFKILGYFDTLADLQEWLQVLPEAGDAYGIGTESPYDIYVWDRAHSEWVNNGPVTLSDAVIDDEDISSEHTWSSTKISTELTAKQTKITASGMLKGNGSGGISAATKGTDYGALSFTVTLVPSAWVKESSWAEYAYGDTDPRFFPSGFAYIVTPNAASRQAYAEAGVYADNVSAEGIMTFHCTDAPTSNLTVNIVRVVSA